MSARTTEASVAPLAARMQEVEARSTLHVDPSVIEKIATAIALEIDGIDGSARRVLHVPFGTDNRARQPQASARIAGGVATVQLQCSVAYPAPIEATTSALRTRVQRKLSDLTGLQISRVDIDVTSLRNGSTERKARVQ